MSTLFDLAAYGYLDREGVLWRLGDSWEANELLSRYHYLGPLHSGSRMTIVGSRDGESVAAMMWKHPTSRGLPSDGSWLELSRWCLTPAAGENAGSRMHKWSVRLIRDHLPEVTTLVSYSDPTHGHTGSLYRACNWQWAPTWHRLRPAPSGHGDWGTGRQGVKDRWVFCVQRDTRRGDVLSVDDPAAVRFWQANGTEVERGWAKRSLNLASVDVELGDRFPRQNLVGVDNEAESRDVANDCIPAVNSDIPSRLEAENVRRIGLAPVKLHGSTIARGGAA